MNQPSNQIGTSCLHWLGRGVGVGLVLVAAINAATYFFYSKGLVDLVGHNQRVTESFGWPWIVWKENAKGIEITDYQSVLLNFAVAIMIGIAIGVFAILIRRQLNQQVREFEAAQSKKKNQSGAILQFSMKSLLLITTLTAMIIGVLNHWSTVERKEVKSSNIGAVGYSWLTGTLEIEFTDGAVYQYFEFPKSEYEGLMEADSHGRYFHTSIRGNYDYVRAETKRVNGFLLATFLFGPLIMVIFAMTPNRIGWQTRGVLLGIVGLLLVLLAIYAPWRNEMPRDRVMLGIFAFWTPQIALGVLVLSGYWTLKSILGTRNNADEETAFQ